MSINTLIVTWFGTGLSPKAPGTVGSLATLPLIYMLYVSGWMMVLLPLTVAILWVGTWQTRIYMQKTGREDPKEVVIDEVAGQCIAIGCVAHFYLPQSVTNFPLLLLIGFLLFRLFDIIKPWPISHIDRNVKTAWGVMLDDILAGFFAAVVLNIGVWQFL